MLKATVLLRDGMNIIQPQQLLSHSIYVFVVRNPIQLSYEYGRKSYLMFVLD